MTDKITIHVMRCGTVGTDETIPDRSRSANPLAYTGVLRARRHQVWLPVYTYLIEHPDGRILVDTGWHTDVRKDQRRALSWQLNIASKAVLPPGEAVTEHLAALDLKPEDLDLVLLTHLDVDHVSGLKLVRNAKKIVTSEAELAAAEGGDIRYNKKFWEGTRLEAIHLKDGGIGPQGHSLDVFVDGTVRFVDLSGHSAGTTGVLVEKGGSFVLITADACYNRANWEDMKLPGITADRDKALAALAWVRGMSRDPRCAQILATHDAGVEPQVITL